MNASVATCNPKTIEITKTVPIKKEYLIKVQWNHEQYVRFREEAKATNKDQVQISSYVGIDLRKKTLQVETQDSKGSILHNKKRTESCSHVKSLSAYQKMLGASYNHRQPYEVFRFLRDDLRYEMILSNPVSKKGIAISKKKIER